MTPKEALAKARGIALTCKLQGISYDEAKERCAPLLALINRAGKEIAIKYNKRYRPITFTVLLR